MEMARLVRQARLRGRYPTGRSKRGSRNERHRTADGASLVTSARTRGACPPLGLLPLASSRCAYPGGRSVTSAVTAESHALWSYKPQTRRPCRGGATPARYSRVVVRSHCKSAHKAGIGTGPGHVQGRELRRVIPRCCDPVRDSGRTGSRQFPHPPIGGRGGSKWRKSQRPLRTGDRNFPGDLRCEG